MKKKEIILNSLQRGIIINDKNLLALRPIFVKWIDNIRAYCNYFPGRRGDAPYWHDEMVIASTLQGAIWSVGGVALSEYPAKKGEGFGRIDIWLRWIGENYVIEAKRAKMHVDKYFSPNTFIRKIDKKFDRVRDDCQKLRKPKGRFLGVVFAVPSMFDEGEINTYKLLQIFQSALIQSNYGILAWVFPKTARTLKYRKIYPGVGLVVMEIKRSQLK